MVISLAISAAIGSSPLARGVHCNFTVDQCSYRITPACAGNTRPTRKSGRPSEDHPRSREEYKFITILNSHFLGSSPLARGILCNVLFEISHDGITPAYAGSTYRNDFGSFLQQDHPRLRGEYGFPIGTYTSQWGSPPLARGVLFYRIVFKLCDWITPACTGSTCNYAHSHPPV